MPNCLCAGAVVAKAAPVMHEAAKSFDAFVAVLQAVPALPTEGGLPADHVATLSGDPSGRHLRTFYVSLLC